MCLTLQPQASFTLVRQIANHTDSSTYYVRAVIRNAYTDELISTLDLTDRGSQRFSKNWQVPADPSGEGFYLSIVTSVYTDSGRLRPDLIVHLPGGKRIVVDAKAPLEAYLDAQDAPDEEARGARLQAHARQVRDHMDRQCDDSGFRGHFIDFQQWHLVQTSASDF